MDASDRFSEKRSDTDRGQFGPAGRRRHGVGGDHIVDELVGAQPLDGASGEQPMGAGNRHRQNAEVPEPLGDLEDRPAGGDLVVQHDRVPPGDIADDRIDHHSVICQSPLAAGGDRQPE